MSLVFLFFAALTAAAWSTARSSDLTRHYQASTALDSADWISESASANEIPESELPGSDPTPTDTVLSVFLGGLGGQVLFCWSSSFCRQQQTRLQRRGIHLSMGRSNALQFATPPPTLI